MEAVGRTRGSAFELVDCIIARLCGVERLMDYGDQLARSQVKLLDGS